MQPAERPLLSIVVPMYNEEEGMVIFFDRIIPILQGITPSWEILCINDGSRDRTLEMMREYAKRDPRIRYISLSRNFGKEAALTAGLHHALGQAVIPIDADLQDPPEIIPEMVAKWQEGYKVVLATRRTRDGDTWFKKTSAHWFYRLMTSLSSFPVPENTGDFRLMDSQVVDSVCQLNERTRFMKGLFAWAGYKTAQIHFDRAPRAAGEAKQKIGNLVRLAKDGIFSFTTMPLRLSTYVGCIMAVMALGYGAFIVVRTLIHGVETPGYASLMAVLLFIGSLQLISLGIMGEYIGRIYRETKQRPLYVVEERSDG